MCKEKVNKVWGPWGFSNRVQQATGPFELFEPKIPKKSKRVTLARGDTPILEKTLRE